MDAEKKKEFIARIQATLAPTLETILLVKGERYSSAIHSAIGLTSTASAVKGLVRSGDAETTERLLRLATFKVVQTLMELSGDREAFVKDYKMLLGKLLELDCHE